MNKWKIFGAENFVGNEWVLNRMLESVWGREKDEIQIIRTKIVINIWNIVSVHLILSGEGIVADSSN